MACVPRVTSARANASASGIVAMKAPRPALTSSRIASAPAASFLLITLLAISGTESTVALASRSA